MLQRLLVVLFLLTSLQACLPISTPVKYIDIDGVSGSDELLVVLTSTRVDNQRSSKERFELFLTNIIDHIDTQPGLYGYALRKELFGDRAWTMTAWTNEHAMLSFKSSPTHLPAMQEASEILNAATFARMVVKVDDFPLDWKRAIWILETNGDHYDFRQRGNSTGQDKPQ